MNRSRKKETDFTRNRKLDFPSVVSLIMSIMTKPIHAELCSSFPKLKAGIVQPTQQSFSEARQKIHYQAFEEIFQQGVRLGLSASDGKTFRGYRLLAITPACKGRNCSDGTLKQDYTALSRYFLVVPDHMISYHL